VIGGRGRKDIRHRNTSRKNHSHGLSSEWSTLLKAADVPSWMFIGWINQMVAILDKREGRAVHAILQELARTYPQVSKVVAADVYVWEMG